MARKCPASVQPGEWHRLPHVQELGEQSSGTASPRKRPHLNTINAASLQRATLIRMPKFQGNQVLSF